MLNLFVFLENYNQNAVSVKTPFAWSTVEDQRDVGGEIELAPYETLILTKKC